MSQKRRTVLVPGYMREFSCIGSNCEDTCCVGWQVTIDHKTYKKYNKVREPELKPLLDKYIKRNRSNPSEHTYAKIVLHSDMSCPMLNEDKLCSIQVKIGEEFLSDVCSTYPRVTNVVNGMMEKSATLSCPEIARLALLNPEGIEFYETEEPIHTRNIISRRLDTNHKGSAEKAEHYFWELRVFTIQVIQNRAYSLWERLILLGMFYQKVQEYVDTGKAMDIPRLIGTYTNLIEDGSLRDSLNEIPSSVAIQMQLVKELADVRIFQGVKSQRYLECFSELLHGIQYTKEASIEEIAERYQSAHDNHYKPFMAEHEYVLENYLVNHVYKNLFPMGESRQIFREYVMLIVHYAMIKLHLIGMAGFWKEQFAIEHVLKLVQSFSKTVEHNTQYLRHVYELLHAKGYTTMAYMAILIKN